LTPSARGCNIHRNGKHAMAIVRFDCYEVDFAAGQLRKRGARIRLREQPWQILAMLLERPGEVVTREDLQSRLWPHDVIVDFERNLNTAIARLREALGDSADRPRFIETLPRRGYRFVAPVARLPETLSRLRVLVLPFVNSSADPSQDYLCDAITAEIIAELSALTPAHVDVLARTTSMHYKGTHKDVTTIARELTLGYVVEGCVRRAAGEVTIAVQLIRTADQTRVFGDRYGSKLDQIFALQSGVAHALGDQIAVVAGGRDLEERSAVEASQIKRSRRISDLVAYNLYIEGRHYLDRGESPGSWDRARECFDKSVARDPQFAAAYDGLAELWWLAGFLGQIAPAQALSIGIVHALRAVDLDNSLADAHAMLAQYRKQLTYNWSEVDREMALALELDPTSPVVRMRHAVTGLMPHARLEEAVAELERAIDIDPLAVWPRIWLVIMLWLQRRYELALEQGHLLLEIAPTNSFGHLAIGVVYREIRRFDEALTALRKAADLAGGAPMVLGWLGLALAESRDIAGARDLLARLRAMSHSTYVPASSIAHIQLGLGEVDAFFESMNRAIDERDHMVMAMKTYPFLDSIRNDPRYITLLERMNLK
jgi:TolB-like protein